MNTKQSGVKRSGMRLLLGVGVVVVGIAVFSYAQLGAVAPDTTIAPISSAVEIENLDQSERVPELPARLMIPALEIDTVVQHIGLAPDNSGEMDVPSNFTDVGWYEYGVRPGMSGSAVIAGHLDGRDVPEAVFYDLHTLQVGDEVIVRTVAGVDDVFVVTRIETYAHDAPTDDVFISTDGAARLNLITCSGEWVADENLYDERTVVFTEHVSDVE